MIDQVRSLKKKGVSYSIVTSSGDIEKELLATDNSLSSDSLLFCTPEDLVRSKWRYAIEGTKISEKIVAFVIDEADCVSKWSAHIVCFKLILYNVTYGHSFSWQLLIFSCV